MNFSRVADGPLGSVLNNSTAIVSDVFKKVPVSRWRSLLLFIIIVWICHSVANVFWSFIPLPDIQQPALSPSSTSKPTQQTVSVNISALQSTHLFGYIDPNKPVVVERKPEVVQTGPLPETALRDLELKGIVSNSDPTLSIAIIGKGNRQDSLRKDDPVPGKSGVKIFAVENFRVILDNNGKKEVLNLYDEERRNSTARTAPQPRPVARPAPVAPQRPKPNKVVVTREQLSTAKSIGDVVRFTVATDRETGEMIGYKVRPGRKRELFDQVGLKLDDIVQSVNGIEVNEPQKVREVYQALKTVTEVNLEVLREGGTLPIQISLDNE